MLTHGQGQQLVDQGSVPRPQIGQAWSVLDDGVCADSARQPPQPVETQQDDLIHSVVAPAERRTCQAPAACMWPT